MNMRKSLNQLADKYTDSPEEREAFIEDMKAYISDTWHYAINARDSQLADRFPMQCAFLKRSNVDHPEVQ